ncbi:MAG: hypothetical protein WC554_11225 [Clostridia bacterium]|jgi:recombination protein RecA
MSRISRKQDVSEVEQAISEDREDLVEERIGVLDPNRLIPTGSTLLNLALSDSAKGGFYLGTMANIIGDSSAGKTLLLLSTFAEMTYNKNFDEHEFIYDEPEVALEFDIEKLFGKKVEDRIGRDITSSSVEDFHDNLLKKTKGKKPFIYGLDSLDAIRAEDDYTRDVREGSYGGSKPKLISETLPKIAQGVKNTNSAVIIISQTRDNIGVKFGNKKTRSGGKALKFFCTHELWMSVESHIKRKERNVGVNVKIKVSKNKLTGKERVIGFPVYYDYGIDDVVSCIDFLIEEKRWTKEKQTINTHGDFINGTEKILIPYIEENKERRNKLIEITEECWKEVEESIATDRPPKYQWEMDDDTD